MSGRDTASYALTFFVMFSQAINKALTDFSKHPKLKDTDSVLVVIMSHGKLGAVLGVDCKEPLCANEEQDAFEVNNIYKQLSSDKCPALLNKPKIIIIQACRGGDHLLFLQLQKKD